MFTECISWVQTPSVNLGIFHTLHLNKLQKLCMWACVILDFAFEQILLLAPLFSYHPFSLLLFYCHISFLSLKIIAFFSSIWLLIFCCLLYFILDGRYEDAFNRFVEEINALAAYQWWEGSIYSILCILAYPLAWSWQQWRRRKKLQRLREFVRSEYDHSCLRSCRSRALYEGLKVCTMFTFCF